MSPFILFRLLFLVASVRGCLLAFQRLHGNEVSHLTAVEQAVRQR